MRALSCGQLLRWLRGTGQLRYNERAECSIPEMISDHVVDVTIMMDRMPGAGFQKPRRHFKSGPEYMKFGMDLIDDSYNQDFAGQADQKVECG